MKELSDDELQEFLNSGSMPDDSALSDDGRKDMQAYQTLFSALGTEPNEGPGMSFAANVRRKLQEQLNRKSDMRFNLFALGLFAGVSLLAYVLLRVLSPESGAMIMAAMVNFKWALLSLLVGFFAFLFIDQRLVKRSY